MGDYGQIYVNPRPHAHNYCARMNAQISPNIAYFLIYNPTISLSTNTEKDEDEDAREEAHILFYTSQDQVTSKDRILRQVGLAKAIVSFSEHVLVILILMIFRLTFLLDYLLQVIVRIMCILKVNAWYLSPLNLIFGCMLSVLSCVKRFA